MAETSFLFAVGRIKALESNLLDHAQWQRLSEADEKEGMKILEEAGYGQEAEDKKDLEALIGCETVAVRSLIAEISPDPVLTDLFLLPTDGHNIKVMLKSILMRTEANDLLLAGGCLDWDLLAKSMESGDYDDLPEALAEALKKAENQEDPRILSAIVDNGIYAHILRVLESHKNALLKDYYLSKIDFTNVLTIIRCNVLSWEMSKVRPLLLEGGEIDEKTLLDALGIPWDMLSKQLATGRFSSLLKEALDEYAQNHDITTLEQCLESASLDIIHEERNDSFGIGPIANYLLMKLNEGRALRIMFAGKRAGIKVPLYKLGIR